MPNFLTLETFEKQLRSAFSNIEHITLEDQGHFHRGHHPDRKGGHFAITLVSDDFENLNQVKRHQKIYAALGMPDNENIHALSIQALTVAQWKQKD